MKLAIILVLSAAPFVLFAVMAGRRHGVPPGFVSRARARHDKALARAADQARRLDTSDNRLARTQEQAASKLAELDGHSDNSAPSSPVLSDPRRGAP